MITASGLERLDRCSGSHVIRLRVHNSGKAAERGNAIHRYVQVVGMRYKSKEDALLDVPPEWRQACANIDWERLTGDLEPETIRHEVAYAVDLATGAVRELGIGLGRNYVGLAPTEIAGTNDVEGIQRKTAIPVARDLKTGQLVTSARENWQVKFHAYAQHARCHGAPEVISGLMYLSEEGDVVPDEHRFGAWDLLDVPVDIGMIVDRLDAALEAFTGRGELDVTPGDWCRYCDGFDACPSKVALVRNLVPDLNDIEQTIAALTPEAAGVAWARFKELAPMVKRIDKALKDYVRAHTSEVVLPDGKVIREIPKGRDNVNGERAMALLREYGATQDELQSCIKRAEWTELRACNPPKAKKEQAA